MGRQCCSAVTSCTSFQPWMPAASTMLLPTPLILVEGSPAAPEWRPQARSTSSPTRTGVSIRTSLGITGTSAVTPTGSRCGHRSVIGFSDLAACSLASPTGVSFQRPLTPFRPLASSGVALLSGIRQRVAGRTRGGSGIRRSTCCGAAMDHTAPALTRPVFLGSTAMRFVLSTSTTWPGNQLRSWPICCALQILETSSLIRSWGAEPPVLLRSSLVGGSSGSNSRQRSLTWPYLASMQPYPSKACRSRL